LPQQLFLDRPFAQKVVADSQYDEAAEGEIVLPSEEMKYEEQGVESIVHVVEPEDERPILCFRSDETLEDGVAFCRTLKSDSFKSDGWLLFFSGIHVISEPLGFFRGEPDLGSPKRGQPFYDFGAA